MADGTAAGRDLAQLSQALLDAAARAGAEAADAMAVFGTSVSIDVRDGALEHADRSEGIELGLRVLIGHRQACVSASDVRPETLERMAVRAVAMAQAAPEDPSVGLADPSQLAAERTVQALQLSDPSDEPAPAELQESALRAEAAARAVRGVSQVESSSAGHGRRRVWLAASNGFADGYERTDSALSCVAITGEGTAMERDYAVESRVFREDLPQPEDVGCLAAERTVARAGARKPPTGLYPVVYDERVAASLIGHLVQAVNGAMVVRGASWLRDAVGQQLLPAELSLIEDPHRPRISGSRPFDAEGLPTRRRAIIENGVLTGWTLDLGSARKLGLDSTGNAGRAPSSPPSPSVSNLELTQGAGSRDYLLAEMGTGLLVTSLIGSSINPTTGDYSRGAGGFWVEGGQIAYPVNECTIAGNLREMLSRVRPANDARQHLSRVVPSLLVENVTIAGG